MTRALRTFAVAAILASLGWSVGTAADDPIMSDAEKLRDPDVAKRLAWYRKYLVEAYKGHGVRSREWDAETLDALEKIAEYWAAGTLNIEDVQGAAKLAQEQGSQCPMLTPRLPWGRQLRIRANAAFRALERGYPASTVYFVLLDFKDRQYRAYYKENIKGFAIKDDADTFLKEKILPLAGHVVEQTQEVPGLGYYLLEHLTINLSHEDELREKVLESLGPVIGKHDKEGTIYRAWKARQYVALAWKARGSGWANTVTEEGWKGFNANLAKALPLAERAFNDHPEEGLFARLLASAYRGQNPGRAAFDRFVGKCIASAKFETNLMTESIMWSLRPRWGGSHEAMIEYGRRCARSRRHAFEVPWGIAFAHLDIVLDISDLAPQNGEHRPGLRPAHEHFLKPGVWKEINAYYEDRDRYEGADEAYLAEWLFFAWVCDEREKAREPLARVREPQTLRAVFTNYITTCDLEVKLLMGVQPAFFKWVGVDRDEWVKGNYTCTKPAPEPAPE
jgi:hypothetical protein